MIPTSTPAPSQTSDILTSVANFPLVPVVVIAAVAILVLSVLLFIVIPHFMKRQLLGKATLSEEEIYNGKRDLLTYVKKESPAQGTPVGLAKFWRGKKLTDANKSVILEPLFDDKILSSAHSQDGLVSFFQMIRWTILARPPGYVKLSDRDWNQLASGPINIAIETLIGKIEHQENVTIGDIKDSAVAVGRGASAKNSIEHRDSLTPEQVALLVGALRADASSMPGGSDDAEEAESTADAMEADVKAGRIHSATRKAADLLDLVSKGAGAWTATMTVLKGLGIAP